MIIKMAIADSNSEYIERLMNGLEKYSELKLSVYTDKSSLENALQTKKFDILLFDPSLYAGQLSLSKSVLQVMLLDENVPIPDQCSSFLKIGKYQRISQIYKKILELYADVCGDIGFSVGSTGVQLIAFYSPVGGCGKTTLSLAAAARLAMQGYRTFYLNLEDVASEECYLPQKAEKGMSELMNCLGTMTNFSVKLQGLLQNKKDNLYYLKHFDTPNDVYEIKEEEVKDLLNAIKNTGLFDFIVIDMGISLDGKTSRIFECADRIVLIEKTDQIAAYKMNRFFEQTHIMNEHAGKMLRVLNFGIGKRSMVNTGIPIAETVNMVQNPDASQFITMLANSGISNLISALLS